MNRILIVDDSARMRQMLREIVTPLATEIYEASDGGEAVAFYALQRPDWVLMDWRMKPMDGLQATARIKAQFPEARIVIVSQYDEPDLQREALQAGACGYVPKENHQELRRVLLGAAQTTVDRTGLR